MQYKLRSTRTRRVPHFKPNYLIIIPYCTHAQLSYLVAPRRQLENNYTTIIRPSVLFNYTHPWKHYPRVHRAPFLKQTFLFHSHPHVHYTRPTIRGEHPPTSAICSHITLRPPSLTPNDVLNIKLYARRDRLPCTHTHTHTRWLRPGSPLLNNNVGTIISYFFSVCVCARVLALLRCSFLIKVAMMWPLKMPFPQTFRRATENTRRRYTPTHARVNAAPFVRPSDRGQPTRQPCTRVRTRSNGKPQMQLMCCGVK